ncbi:MAG: CopG family transcriptional regulator [Clostridia bacterium]|nr:CopG family transcriptional regulator [Clostridia bacterium]
MANSKKVVTMPKSLTNDRNSLEKHSKKRLIQRAMDNYISDKNKAKLRKKLKRGYEETAAINIEWAENCLAADNECQTIYEEKLSECE